MGQPHSVWSLAGSGQAQCTSRRNFETLSSSWASSRTLTMHSRCLAQKLCSFYLLSHVALHPNLAQGALGQSSSARRGLPPRAAARALHHQSALASTLTMPCSLLCLFTSFRQVAVPKHLFPQLTSWKKQPKQKK
jgi:hypothetical protein